jgi:hypothetical protein
MVLQQPRLLTQDWHNELLDTWRDQVEQALREQRIGRDLGWDSVDAYEDFLNSLFFYYGESMRAAQKSTNEGGKATREPAGSNP